MQSVLDWTISIWELSLLMPHKDSARFSNDLRLILISRGNSLKLHNPFYWAIAVRNYHVSKRCEFSTSIIMRVLHAMAWSIGHITLHANGCAWDMMCRLLALRNLTFEADSLSSRDNTAWTKLSTALTTHGFKRPGIPATVLGGYVIWLPSSPVYSSRATGLPHRSNRMWSLRRARIQWTFGQRTG